MIKKLTFLSWVLVATLYACQAQPLSQEVKDNIQARVNNGTNAGIVVAVIDEGGPHYFSAGVKSLQSKEPVDERAVFEIGSISKTFTGILLADKVMKGEMKLADPLQNYLPQGITAPVRNSESIKLVHLSNHTSSLPRLPGNMNPGNPANPYADYSEKQLYDFLNQCTLTRDIGSQYEYSNYAQGLLGNVLAKKDGLSYEQLMINVIAKPLGLKDTRIAFTPEMEKNLAKGHAGGYEVANWDIPSLAGAGAIRSTAVDMAKYVSANMGIVKSGLYPAMQLSHKNSRSEGSAPEVGLGWHIMKADDLEITWHNGGTGGYRTFIGFVKGKNRGVVVLSNSNVSIDDIGFHLLNPVAPLKPIEESITVDQVVLDTYVGQYELAPGFILTVTRAGDQLNAQATGQGQFPVFAKSTNVFFYKVVDAQLTFNSKDGMIESVTLDQGGQQLVGKKL